MKASEKIQLLLKGYKPDYIKELEEEELREKEELEKEPEKEPEKESEKESEKEPEKSTEDLEKEIESLKKQLEVAQKGNRNEDFEDDSTSSQEELLEDICKQLMN